MKKIDRDAVEKALEKSLAFETRFARMHATARQSLVAAVDHDAKFSYAGKKDEIVTVGQKFPFLFRGEKLFATDSQNGEATIICEITIDTYAGTKNHQRLSTTGCLSKFFRLDNPEIQYVLETVRIGGLIKFRVKFLEKAIWNAMLFGKAVKE